MVGAAGIEKGRGLENIRGGIDMMDKVFEEVLSIEEPWYARDI